MATVGRRCYVAAPLFTPAERRFNEELVERLSPFLDIYLPQRDGILLAEVAARGGNLEKARREIFVEDTNVIRSSEYLIAVLDGPSVDDGVAFELGFAVALGLVCVGLQTDSRRTRGYFRNPMWSESLGLTFDSLEELIQWAEDLGSRSHVSILTSA